MMSAFQWADAASVDEACKLLGDSAALKAGGVDLLDLMKEHISEPGRLVNIRRIKALDFVSDDPGAGLRLGPLVTLDRLDHDAAVRSRYGVLADAAGHAATPQIRNMATVGGNLLQRPRCWYFRHEDFPCRKKGGDMCFSQEGENQYHAIFSNRLCAMIHPSDVATALVALRATLTLQSARGQREVALESFLTLPTSQASVMRENSLQAGEVLTEIRVPAPVAGTRQAYLKQGERDSADWPIASAAVVLEMNGASCARASVVLGAAAPAPRRARAAETALTGKPVTEALARQAAEAALADATPMSNNAYKVAVFKAVIRRAILAAAGAA